MDGQKQEIFAVPLEGDGSKGYLPEKEQEEPRLSGRVSVLVLPCGKPFSKKARPRLNMLRVALKSRIGPGVGCGFVQRSRFDVQAGRKEEGERPGK